MSTVQATPSAQAENIARNLPPAVQEDFRALMSTVLANLSNLSPGGNLVQPGGAQAGASATPTGIGFAVTGANGAFTIAITPPASAKPNTLWYEVSYGPLVSFTGSGITTLAATTNTSINVPAPGQSYFFRLRASFDKKTWSNYQLASQSAISAGLVESTAMAPAAAFNQTNYAVVNSQTAGSAAAVTISGPAGPLTGYAAQRGTTQYPRPSATVVGVPLGSEQFVGWNGETFELKPTLASVLADNLEPVGKVSVVEGGAFRLPAITPFEFGGGIVGYNVTDQGNGLTEPVTITIVGTGSGATAGPQTIVNGKLLSVAPGNLGAGYGSGTTATVSGGSGGTTPGGGTAAGGNGGRMTDV